MSAILANGISAFAQSTPFMDEYTLLASFVNCRKYSPVGDLRRKSMLISSGDATASNVSWLMALACNKSKTNSRAGFIKQGLWRSQERGLYKVENNAEENAAYCLTVSTCMLYTSG